MKAYLKELKPLLITALLLLVLLVTEALLPSPLPYLVRLVLYLVPYLLIGREILVEAFEKLREKKPLDESFLMAIATIGALALGEFGEAVFVLLFFHVGEFFEELATERSRNNIEELMDLRPDTVTLQRPKRKVKTHPDKAKIGDIMIVAAGERIPLDGVVVEGTSTVDTSSLTGESIPKTVKEGDTVLSGCLNLSGVLQVRITATAAESTVSKILKLIEESSDNKAKSETFIHRFARVYTPIVVALALLLALVPSLIWGEPLKWITNALTLLVISCPCALVVSVPLSYFNGIGAASKNGILVKGSTYLDTLATLKSVVFDKTGTLTYGQFMVSAIHPKTLPERELLQLAALAESQSNHPISQSLLNACPQEADPARFKNAQEFAGEGIVVQIDKKKVLVGNEKLMERFKIPFETKPHLGTMVHVAVGRKYEGHIIISDQIKDTSPEAITYLQKERLNTVMLTGDSELVAQQVAHSIGIDDYYAELLPHEKVDQIKEILANAKNRPCAFVGDGINDAPVLAHADLGIAMGAIGSDAAIEAADVVLMDDDPAKIPTAIRLARKTRAIVQQNIALSLGVKFAVLVLALLGLSNLWLASFADVGVLVLAVLNSIRQIKE